MRDTVGEEISRQIGEAVAFLQAGRAAAAAALCERVLVRRRANFDALHLLGVCRLQLRDPDGAERHLRAALRLRPDFAPAHMNYGHALRELGRAEQAAASYGRAAAIDPKSHLAHHNAGAALEAAGRHAEALACFDRALTIDGPAATWVGRGNCLVALGRIDDAIEAYRAATLRDQHNAQAHACLGAALASRGHAAEALVALDRALVLNPIDGAAMLNRAVALNAQERHAEALLAAQGAVTFGAPHGEAMCQQAFALGGMGHGDEGMALLRELRAKEPAHWGARFVTAADLSAGGRTDRAQQAEAAFLELLAERPGDATVLYHRGMLRMNLGDYSRAREDFTLASAKVERFAWGLGLLDLLEGRFESGWQGYEQRWRDPEIRRERRSFARPPWLGEDSLDGQVLLVHTEQGLGDVLQFCRYLPPIASRGAHVVLEVQPQLAGLVQRGLPGVEVVMRGDPLPDFDRHCPLMSLPLAANTNLASIPASIPYLSADPARAAAWRSRLGATRGPRIGVAWSGNPEHRNDANCSIPLALLGPLFVAARAAGATEFVALQRELRASDHEALAAVPDLRFFGEDLADFDDTAALAALCDLVISVDTAAAHLAGALGRPLWVLLPFVPDWRWMLKRDDSPWYPTARLFRQPRIGDWSAVMDAVAASVGPQLAATRSAMGDVA